MKVLSLSIEKKTFCQNLVGLFDLTPWVGLPLSSTNYVCQHCHLTVSDNIDIDLTVLSTDNVVTALEEKKRLAFDEHLEEGKGCSLDHLVINKRYGLPQNYLIVYWAPQPLVKIREFTFQERSFYPELVICSNEHRTEVVFALYTDQNNQAPNDIFKKLLTNNFQSHLNKEDQEDDLTLDEEAVSRNQHLLPRMYGGGRKTLDSFTYICKWCPDKVLANPTKGRFKQWRNYKDHFEKHHGDVPFDEFLKNVRRKDPKWYCTNCKLAFSLSNKVRHKAICKSVSLQSRYVYVSEKSSFANCLLMLLSPVEAVCRL